MLDKARGCDNMVLFEVQGNVVPNFIRSHGVGLDFKGRGTSEESGSLDLRT